MEFPISTCVSEILSLPANHGGLGIPSLKETAEKLRLGQRFKLHSSSDKELQVLFETTSDQNVRTDSIILTNSSRNEAIREVKATHIQASFDHIVSLKVTGQKHFLDHRKPVQNCNFEMDEGTGQAGCPSFQLRQKGAWFNNFQQPRIWVRWGKSQDPLLSTLQKCQPDKQARSFELCRCPGSVHETSRCSPEDPGQLDLEQHKTGSRNLRRPFNWNSRFTFEFVPFSETRCSNTECEQCGHTRTNGLPRNKSGKFKTVQVSEVCRHSIRYQRVLLKFQNYKLYYRGHNFRINFRY